MLLNNNITNYHLSPKLLSYKDITKIFPKKISFGITVLCLSSLLVSCSDIKSNSPSETPNNTSLTEDNAATNYTSDATNEPEEKTSFDNETLNLLLDQLTKDVSDKHTVLTPYKAIEKVLSLDSDISTCANNISVPREVIEAILLKELSNQDTLDALADASVINYYKDLEESGSSSNKNDSSTGLGQIFASTAIYAHNNLVNRGVLKDKLLAENDNAVKKEVWTNLKDNESYNIQFVSYVIRSNALNLGYKNISTCSEEQLKKLFSRYNGSGKAATEYGKITYNYYLQFLKYHK